MSTVYLLVDKDRHRDDDFVVYARLEPVIKEAVRRLAAERHRWPGMPVDDELTPTMWRGGWRFFAKVGDEGPMIFVQQTRMVR